MHKRNGFTLIEMLVAMSLTLFIMVIITTAFTYGLETFRAMKGIGDMAQGLRTAADRLRNDLKAAHFEGNRHLGDPAFPFQGPVRYGFFRIVQGSAASNVAGSPYQSEGVDLDGLPSWRATDHVLHFSINLRGDRPEAFMTTTVPANGPLDPSGGNFKVTSFFGQPADAVYQPQGPYFSSQWAEVAYFLVPSGTADPNDPKSTPLFKLYRMQRLVVPRADQLQGIVNATDQSKYAGISCQPDANNFLAFNAPEDLAAGQRSFNSPTDPTAKLGATLLLENVVSFQVQVFGGAKNGFQDLPAGNPPTFDTNVGANNNLQGIPAVQITIRVFDLNSFQTQQVTITQDL